MSGNISGWARGFHEAPLAVFSAAAVAGAGIAAARPLAWALDLRADDPGKGLAAAVLVLICAGLLISTLHLGRPARLMRALLRAGTNPLGTEVMFAVLTGIASLMLLCLPGRSTGFQLLWALAALTGLGLLASLAWVYWLPAQLAWKGAAAVSVVPLGLLVGLVVHEVTVLPRSSSGTWAILILTAADAAVWAARCTRVEDAADHRGAAHPSVIAARRWIHIGRLLLVSVPPVAVVLWGSGAAVLAPMGLGIVVDRFAFYGFAIKRTTEQEIARVESLL